MNDSAKLDDYTKKYLRTLARMLRECETADRNITTELHDMAERLERLAGQEQNEESTTEQ